MRRKIQNTKHTQKFSYTFVEGFQDSTDIMIFGGHFDYDKFDGVEIYSAWWNEDEYTHHIKKMISFLKKQLYKLSYLQYHELMPSESERAFVDFVNEIDARYKNELVENFDLFIKYLNINNILKSYSLRYDSKKIEELFLKIFNNLDRKEKQVIQTGLVLKIYLGCKLLKHLKEHRALSVHYDIWKLSVPIMQKAMELLNEDN